MSDRSRSSKRRNSLETRQFSQEGKTIHRLRHKRDFTMVSNSILQNPNLSMKAKGLLSLMLSMPDDWQFYIEDLANRNSDGEFAVRSAIHELAAAGHVKRYPVREDGAISYWAFEIYEEPKS